MITGILFIFACRLGKRDYHLALPYYKMSGLSVTEVIHRNMAMCKSTAAEYGNGFLFFLKHSLYEDTMEDLSEVSETFIDSKSNYYYYYYLK